MNLPGERRRRRNSLREAIHLHFRHAKALEQITAGEFGDLSDDVMRMLQRMLAQKNAMLDSNPLNSMRCPAAGEPKEKARHRPVAAPEEVQIVGNEFDIPKNPPASESFPL